MENHHFQWENSLFLWPFSIAILTEPEGNHHKIPYKIPLNHHFPRSSTWSLPHNPRRHVDDRPPRHMPPGDIEATDKAMAGFMAGAPASRRKAWPPEAQGVGWDWEEDFLKFL